MLHLAPIQFKTNLLFLKLLWLEPPNKYWKPVLHHPLILSFQRYWYQCNNCRENFPTYVWFKGKKPATLCSLDNTLGHWERRVQHSTKLLNENHCFTTFSTSKFYIPLGSLPFCNSTESGILEGNIYNAIEKGLPWAILHRSIVTLLSSLHQSTGEQVAAMGLHTWVLQTFLK